MEADMKICVRCNEEKSLAQFYKTKYTHHEDGYDYYCKYCRNGSTMKSQRTNKKSCSMSECTGKHYAHGYCRTHYSRNLRTGTPEGKHSNSPNSKRDMNLRYHYLITLDEFNKRAANGCEICGDKPEKTLHVDHDHKCCHTGITCGKCVRGIICSKCNKAVDRYERGLMRLDYPNIDKVKHYLEVYSG